MRYKGFIAAVTAVFICFSSVAFAKSDAYMNDNIDRMRALLYEEDFRVFVENAPEYSVYYGAKFEPRSGVIIGTPENCKFDGIENGIDTCYDWFVPSEDIINDKVPRVEKAEVPSDHSQLIGWNWNFKSQVPVDMSRYENYIKNYIDNLASMGKDILLVFGKEMNIDDNFLDEQVFIDCYRYVAEYAKTKENIAMVWAPNDTGGLDTRLIDFWPGDEYVDWVGCSLYSMPNFEGNANADDGANMCFIMGDYANPVMRAKVIHEFMEEYGIKKPVFITEGGIGYEHPGGEDYTGWALQQLRKYYGELVRVYPEFKCIVSFNNYVADGDYYRYDMGNNPVLLENMQYLTQDPIYITDYPNSAPVSYTEMFDGIDFYNKVKLSAYGYLPKNQWMTVKYIIDGKTVHTTQYPPYNYETYGLSEGTHRLKVEFYTEDYMVKSFEYDFGFWVSEPEPIPTPASTPAPPPRVYSQSEYEGDCGFNDMENAPNEMKNAVAKLSAAGVVNGRDENTFDPSGKVTRAELAAMLSRMLNLKGGQINFPDVTEDSWYSDSVSAVASAGMINGFEDGTFKPDGFVTNEQFAAVTAKYLKSLGKNAPHTKLPYSDTISEWARDYVQTANAFGIVLPYEDNTFRGQDNVMRGDCAVMLYRFLELI